MGQDNFGWLGVKYQHPLENCLKNRLYCALISGYICITNYPYLYGKIFRIGEEDNANKIIKFN
jgi:hypothetical protein